MESKPKGKSGGKTSRSKSKKKLEKLATQPGQPTSPPKATKNAKKRGVGLDVEVNPPKMLSEEEAIKRFGPCHVDAKQAHTAILLLKSEETHVVLEALNSLQKFMKKRYENKEIFVQLDGVQAAHTLIRSTNQVVQRLAWKLIAMSSGIHRAKLICRDTGMVLDAIDLGQTSTDDVVIEYCSLILSNCATLFTGRLQVIQNGGVPLMLHFIKTNDDPDIQKNSAECIWRLLEESLNVELISTEDSIRPIIALCESEYPALQIIAYSILEKFSKLVTGVKILEHLKMIPNLAQKVGNLELGDLHRVILKVMINMAASPESCKQMAGLLTHFVELLNNSKDLKAQSHAITLLGKVASDPILTRSVVDAGITQKLITVLSTYADSEIREACCFTAAQLATADHRARNQLIEAIPALVTFLNDPKITARGTELGLILLALILEEGTTSCPSFVDAHGLQLLKKILDNFQKHSDQTLLSSLTCLSLLLRQYPLRPRLVHEGFVGSVLGCFKKTNPQLLALVGNSVCGLLCEAEGRDQFLKHEGYTFVSDLLLNAEEFPVATAVVPLIHMIGSYPNIAKEFIDKGVLQTIWKRQDLISCNGPFRTAYEQLISTHLPAKFAITGHIEAFEILENGFYDSGHLRKNERFHSLVQMSFEERDPEKRIIYLNLSTNVEPEVLELNPSLQHMIDQAETIAPYIEQVQQALDMKLLKSERELVGLIATIIAEKYGGQLDKWRVSVQSEELELVDLQNKFESVVVPLTMLNTGAHRPRAIQFKAICDHFGIPCTLDRGGYKKYWNVVLLNAKRMDADYCPCVEVGDNRKNPVFTEKLRRFVVDLIYQPGSLFPLHSYEANAYCFY